MDDLSCRDFSRKERKRAKEFLGVKRAPSFRSLRQTKWGIAEKREKDRKKSRRPGKLTKPATSLIRYFVPWFLSFWLSLRRPNPLFVSFRSLRQIKMMARLAPMHAAGPLAETCPLV